MSNQLIDIMNAVADAQPTTGEFAEDARYVWPARWDALYTALSVIDVGELPACCDVCERLHRDCTCQESNG